MTNTSERRRERWARVTAVVDWITRILGTLAFILVAVGYVDVRATQAELERTQECQARFNEAQAQRSQNLDGDLTRERNASRRVDDALAAIVAAALTGKPTLPAEARRLITELSVALGAQAKARADADRAREANPPVPEPATHC
jgi:hypothetical protein